MQQAASNRQQALAAYGILDTPPEPEFDDIVQIARRFCQTPVALVSLVTDNRQWFKARVGFAACETSLAQSVCVHALSSSDLFIIPDLTLDERTRDNTLVTGAPFIRFYAGAPLTTPEGVAIGSLCVIDVQPRPEGLTSEQKETLQALARQTMAAIVTRQMMAVRETAVVASEAARDRLREAEALVRNAQEAARVGSFEVEIATDVFVVSAEFCRIFGLPPQDAFDADVLQDLILLQDRSAVASTRATRQDGSAPHDVEYRIRRQNDGALRWIGRRGAFVCDSLGSPIRMQGVVQDITERKLAELKSRALIRLGDQLRTASTIEIVGKLAGAVLGECLSAFRAGYGVIDEPLGTFTVRSNWTASGAESMVGTWPSELFQTTISQLRNGAPLTVANVAAASWLAADMDAYKGNGIASQIKVPLIENERLAGTLFVHHNTPRTWTPAEVDFAVDVADRTYAAIARIRAEDHQRVLNEELSHRLKNTLSMVQAIATQTLRPVTERSVVKALEDRIIALSKAHDVLLQQSWSAAPVAKVVDAVLGLHGRVDHFDITGPAVTMGPKATLSLSMLLHELTTNSLKYGALSVPSGRVALDWRILGDDADPKFAMMWTETGGPPAKAPTRRGFGSRLISMGLAGTGHADLDYSETGLRANFGAPLHSITSN